MATAAEIAHVGRVFEVSSGVLAAHIRGPAGLCAFCGDRGYPCSGRLEAQRAAAWATRRVDEINAELQTHYWNAILSPTVVLPVLGAGVS